jgi:hypothetical protein
MQTTYTIAIRLTRPDREPPEGWLADADLVFESGDLEGLSLVGFNLQRTTANQIEVGFPKRVYSVGRAKRDYTFLRPTHASNPRDAEARLTREIIRAYQEALAANST